MSRRKRPAHLEIAIILLSLMLFGEGVSQLASNAKASPAIEFGYSVHQFNEVQGQLVGASGSKWVRSDVEDRGQGPYIYTTDGYGKYRQSILAILDYYSIPAKDKSNFTLSEWGNVVAEAAQNLKNRTEVRAYEIWNEPDLKSNYDGYMDGSAQHYVDMLKVAYTELKSVNPSLIVVGGVIDDPTAPSHWQFLTDILNLRAANYMDAFSIHPYYLLRNGGIDYSVNFGNVITSIETLAGKPVWVTEMGETSAGPNETEASQAAYMKERFQEMLTSTYTPPVVIWYDFVDDVNPDSTFGVVHSNYALKESYHTFASFATSNSTTSSLTSTSSSTTTSSTVKTTITTTSNSTSSLVVKRRR